VASIAILKTGKSMGSVVKGQIVIDPISAKAWPCRMTTGRGLPA
jgi:hypothetical protein